MASVIQKFAGKLEDQEIELVCTEEKLTVTITPANKLYFWQGIYTSEILKSSQQTLCSVKELYDAIVEVLSGSSINPANLRLNKINKTLECSFTFFKKTIQIEIPLERMQHNLEMMQEHLYNHVGTMEGKLLNAERKINDHLLFQREVFNNVKEEEFKKWMNLNVSCSKMPNPTRIG